MFVYCVFILSTQGFRILVSLPPSKRVLLLFPGQKMTSRSYNLLIAAAWLNAVFWSSMPIVGWAGYAPDPTGATCTINWRQNDASVHRLTFSISVSPSKYSYKYLLDNITC